MTLLCGLTFANAVAQVAYTSIAVSNLDASICWNVRIGHTGNSERVELLGRIYDDNNTLLIECKSDRLLLRNGENNLLLTTVRTASIKFHDDEVKKHLELFGSLPKGRYQFCTTVRKVADGDELGEDCISLTQTDAGGYTKNAQNGRSKAIQFYGRASIEHIYANRQGADQATPPHLMRFQAQPGVNIFNVPVGLNLYYTTERNNTYPNQFAASFQFDEQKFKYNLRQLVENKIAEETKLNSEMLDQQNLKLAELDGINSQLEGLSPRTDEIASLENQINSGDYSQIDQSISTLTAQASDALKKIDYDNLKAKYTEQRNELNTYVPKDSLEEKQKKVLADTLDLRLQKLEAKKDSTLKKLDGHNEKLAKAIAKKNEAMQMLGKLNQLKANAEQYRELTEKKNELETFQSTLGQQSNYNVDDVADLNDPMILKENLIERGLFTGTNKLFFGIRQLTIGTVYPFYSPHLLNGIQVHGGAVEINPGIFFLNITGGNTNIGSTNFLDLFRSSYERWMVGGRIGLGKAERSHFFVSYVHSVDRSNSSPLEMTDEIRPQQNDVLGADLQVTFLEGKVRFNGSMSGSGFNRNRNDEDLEVEGNDFFQDLPEFLRPNISTSYDFAYSGSTTLNIFKGNMLHGYTEYIGPGYYAFGVPFLRNDVLRYGARAEQSVWKSRMKLIAKYRYEIDNLIESKRSTTTTHSIGGGIAYRQRKMPTLKADYTINLRKGDLGEMTMHNLMLASGHSYKVSSTSLRTGVNYQFISSGADSISASSYTLHNVTVTQSVSLKKPVTLLARIGFNTMESVTMNRNQVLVGAGMTNGLVKNLTSGLNLDYIQSLGADSRFSLQMDLNYSFLKYFDISFNLTYNQYDEPISTGSQIDEVILTTRLVFEL